MVLGRMTARVDALPGVGEEHVVVGAARGERRPQDVHRHHAVRRRRAGRRRGPSTSGSRSTRPPFTLTSAGCTSGGRSSGTLTMVEL